MKKRVWNIPLYVWLCYLLALTLVGTSTTAARYVSSASASDSARVARFQVSAAAYNSSVVLDENTKSASYAFSITCNSEVTAECVVKVEVPNNIPAEANITMELTCGTYSGIHSVVSGTTAYTFTAFPMPPGNTTYNCTLTFTANNIHNVDDFQIDEITISAVAQQTNG